MKLGDRVTNGRKRSFNPIGTIIKIGRRCPHCGSANLLWDIDPSHLEQNLALVQFPSIIYVVPFSDLVLQKSDA